MATDTICAIATPSGKGGVSIVRISGPCALATAEKMLGYSPVPRHAHYGPFLGDKNQTLDMGLALFFKGPDSFTGEDVLELHSHGGPVLADEILQYLVFSGCRLARPGEFSERAFLNDKMDLAQAEAIADLINSDSREAAHSALRTLQGAFSEHITHFVDELIALRTYVEASMDFPEEEVDFLTEGDIYQKLCTLKKSLGSVFSQARQGAILKEGLRVVIAGQPNAGKSSLLNTLSGQESAIVTDIPGTTRDTLKEQILVHGIPLHVIDTAGLRESSDPVEREGIRRAWQEIDKADVVLLVSDLSQGTDNELRSLLLSKPAVKNKLIILANKIDRCDEHCRIETDSENLTTIYISARDGTGIELLRDHLRDRAGLTSSAEGTFLARRRHLEAMTRADHFLDSALAQFDGERQGELIAEDLREAQLALCEITGEFSSDDLLGEIFSNFCIGK